MTHPSLEELAAYAFSPETSLHDTAIALHLPACAKCEGIVREFGALDHALGSQTAWEVAEGLHHLLDREAEGVPLASLSSGSESLQEGPAPEVIALARQIEEEDAEADALLSPIFLDRHLKYLWTDVSRKPEFRLPGVVRKLCYAAREACGFDPELALDLANDAVSIAEELPDDIYPKNGVYSVRGLAYKDRANALCYTGDYEDALAALDAADAAYQKLAVSEHPRMVVAFVRGTVLYHADRFAEALVWARRVIPFFARNGEPDRERWRHARLLEGAVLYASNAYRLAKAVFDDVLASAERDRDQGSMAYAANALAVVEIDLGDFASARNHALFALTTYSELGIYVETVRARWTIGRLLLAEGNLDRALAQFRLVSAEFRNLGMMIEMALTELDIAEILRAQSEVAEVRALCTRLVAQFKDAGMLTSQLTALAFLEEEAVKGRVTSRVIQHVRQFIETSPRHPKRAFAPPPDAVSS